MTTTLAGSFTFNIFTQKEDETKKRQSSALLIDFLDTSLACDFVVALQLLLLLLLSLLLPAIVVVVVCLP